MKSDVFELGDWLLRIGARWRQYAFNVLVAGVIMSALTYAMPSWYRSTTVLLPPEETDDMSGGSMVLQRFLQRVPSLTGVSRYYTPSDVYRAVLVSRSVQTVIATKFGMQKVYKKKNLEKTIEELRRHVRVALAPDGTISVAVEDRSRERAAGIANAFVDELDRFNREKRNSQGRRARLFLESRVANADSLQRIAATSLAEYQKAHHVVVPTELESANLSPVADLMAKRMALAVRLSVLRTYLSETSEQVVQARTELEQLQGQLGQLPDLQDELSRRTRDVRLYQQVYLLLSAQLEDARLREAMTTPTVTVLDPAIPVERRARPIRWLWAGIAMMVSFLASVLWFERSGRSRPVA